MTKKYTSNNSNPPSETPLLWRSYEDRQGSPEFSADLDHDKARQSELSEGMNVNRRRFMTLMGASMTLASLTTTGCIRKPVERILPYAKRPEEIIPGKPIFYATAMNVGPRVLGLLVESQEGRPTKVEGNQEHPLSMGATDAWAQASVLNLYDPDRSQKPQVRGKEESWTTFFRQVNAAVAPLKGKQGDGLALLVEETPSPSFQQQLRAFSKAFPKAQIYRYDAVSSDNVRAASSIVGMPGSRPFYQLSQANVVFGVDSDFLQTEGDAVRNIREFASRRGTKAIQGKSMNRFYAVESNFTSTGASADHRLRVASSDVGDFLNLLTVEVMGLKKGTVSGVGADFGQQLTERANDFKKNRAKLYASWKKWMGVLAKDLVANAGNSVVVVGRRQPGRVQALGLFLNAWLGNIGKSVTLVEQDEVAADSLSSLAAAAQGGAVDTLVMLGGNPLYDAPADLNFSKVLQSINTTIHHSFFFNETSEAVTLHAPANHYLESWGDLQSTDGTVALQQPLIAPLFGSLTHLELLAYLNGSASIRGYDLVRNYWKSKTKGDFETSWRRWLHDGIVDAAKPKATKVHFDGKGLLSAWGDTPAIPDPSKFEVNFVADASVYDGRFANNPWLQECPDPMSKLTWDNAAFVSKSFADSKKLKNGHFIRIKNKGLSLELPIFVMPGLLANSIVLPLGYGRKFGRVATIEGAGGFNSYQVRTSDGLEFSNSATVETVPYKPRYKLASTQEYGRLVEPLTGRKRDALLRETSLDELSSNPAYIKDLSFMKESKIKSLWYESNNTAGQQWGLSIDLGRCTGCGTCTVACQAENNISVVGKKEVLNGREMHWIRIDRYYRGSDEDNLQASMQPVACMHCEVAPCENVCPVAATAHSTDGMNDMAYNRCIGTRYCANNCPYKVRRFNFYNFSKRNDQLLPTMELQRNPDVTVRFRGVMEKCSYCVQRINEAKIEAKTKGNGIVPDGAITTACQQACPAQAIVFGDVSDPKSQVSIAKKENREYDLLSELNTKPRTSYLANIRNPNKTLVPPKKVQKKHNHSHDGHKHDGHKHGKKKKA